MSFSETYPLYPAVCEADLTEPEEQLVLPISILPSTPPPAPPPTPSKPVRALRRKRRQFTIQERITAQQLTDSMYRANLSYKKRIEADVAIRIVCYHTIGEDVRSIVDVYEVFLCPDTCRIVCEQFSACQPQTLAQAGRVIMRTDGIEMDASANAALMYMEQFKCEYLHNTPFVQHHADKGVYATIVVCYSTTR